LVLAAGEARRFDYSPKQLLEFEGQTLVRRAIETALNSTADVVCVVLGAYSEQIMPTIDDLPILIVVNDHWSDGIGMSIKSGLETLIQQIPELDSVAIMLADQPLIESRAIDQLFELTKTNGIAAAEYEGTIGVPAAFTRQFFGELLSLEANEGAKRVISRHSPKTLAIDAAAFDIDTPADFTNLQIIRS
jgi:molybdenum cofactor cytidylyltransferase